MSPKALASSLTKDSKNLPEVTPLDPDPVNVKEGEGVEEKGRGSINSLTF
jgi:hypothetical protein